MVNDERFTFKLSSDLKKRIATQAMKEQRLPANLVRKIVTDYLDQNED